MWREMKKRKGMKQRERELEEVNEARVRTCKESKNKGKSRKWNRSGRSEWSKQKENGREEKD